MRRIGIAMSGGPNPAEIIDLVVLAERLGYESAWVAEGMAATGAPSWRPAPCGPRASWGQGHAVFECHTEKLQSERWLGGETATRCRNMGPRAHAPAGPQFLHGLRRQSLQVWHQMRSILCACGHDAPPLFLAC